MIFYFTGTGNSLYAAENLALILNERLIDIASAVKNEEYVYQTEEKEKIGFIFPCYFFGIPTIVTEFIEKLILKNNPESYIFSVITCGSNIGGADKMFRHKLAKRGYKLSCTYSLITPNNYILWYEAGKVAELAKSEIELKNIASGIVQAETRGYRSGFVGRLLTAVSYPVYIHTGKTSKFYAEDSCTFCGLCERICPCEVIKLTNGKPEWTKKRCTQCLGCINRCPTAAIQFGNSTKRRGRFVNPVLINNKNLINKSKTETNL